MCTIVIISITFSMKYILNSHVCYTNINIDIFLHKLDQTKN
jgi:hypothetical protein